MKEQFDNSFAKKLEEIPKLKPESHFFINDGALNVLNGSPLTEIEKNSFDAISMELQELDRDIVSYLLNIKSKNIISRDEYFIITSYFLASKQIGPDSTEVRNSFYKSIINNEDFELLARNVSIPENTRSVIVNAYKKIYDFNHKDANLEQK